MTAPTEAQFQAAVLELAQLRGRLCFHDFDSRRNAAGYPDLTLVHERTGELLFAELKTHKGRVSQAQQRWLDALVAGGHAAHVWRPEHLRSGQIARALRWSAPEARRRNHDAFEDARDHLAATLPADAVA